MRPTIRLESYVVQNPEILASGLDNETILLSIERSSYYGLNPIATRIWELLVVSLKVYDILKTLMLEFEVDEATCKHDLLTFLQSLAIENLIIIKNEKKNYNLS